MERYKARPDRIVRCQGRTITDDARGVGLTESSAVRDHLRCGRLLPVPAVIPDRPVRRVEKE